MLPEELIPKSKDIMRQLEAQVARPSGWRIFRRDTNVTDFPGHGDPVLCWDQSRDFQ